MFVENYILCVEVGKNEGGQRNGEEELILNVSISVILDYLGDGLNG